MDRVATAMIPRSAMSDIGRAQRELVEAARQSSAQTKSTDLKGYGREAQTLVSAQRMVARTDGFIATASELTTRMEIQDVSLGRAADMVAKLKEDLFQNVGLESGEGIRSRLEEAFSVLKDAMNSNLGGRFLFGGVVNDAPPITAVSLDHLAASDVTDVIGQDSVSQLMRVEEGRMVKAGLVAKDFVTEAFESLKRLAEMDNGPDGPFSGDLTQPQLQLVKNELTALGEAYDALLMAQAENGRMTKDVEAASERQVARKGALNEAIGGMVNVDLAEVAVRLKQAEFSYQASAGVFQTLRDLSLLNYLT